MRRRLLFAGLGSALVVPRARADISFAATAQRLAATTGQASVTGTTSETNLGNLLIPAGALGSNGVIEIYSLWTYTNSSNNKSLILRFNTTSGAISGGTMGGTSSVVTTTAATQMLNIIRANNSVAAQLTWNASGTFPFTTTANAPVVTNINTAANSYINLNGILALGTETITLMHAYALIFRA